MLWLDDSGIGVRNGAGYLSKIRTNASATRVATIEDSDGMLYPALVSKLAADVTSSSITPATVTGWNVSLQASSTYEFELLLILESVLTTTSPKWNITGPTSETTFVYYETMGVNVTAAGFTAWGASGTNAANAPANNTPYLVRIRGVVKTTGTTPATPVGLDFYSEVAASQVKLKAGSIMLFRKIA